MPGLQGNASRRLCGAMFLATETWRSPGSERRVSVTDRAVVEDPHPWPRGSRRGVFLIDHQHGVHWAVEPLFLLEFRRGRARSSGGSARDR